MSRSKKRPSQAQRPRPRFPQQLEGPHPPLDRDALETAWAERLACGRKARVRPAGVGGLGVEAGRRPLPLRPCWWSVLTMAVLAPRALMFATVTELWGSQGPRWLGPKRFWWIWAAPGDICRTGVCPAHGARVPKNPTMTELFSVC